MTNKIQKIQWGRFVFEDIFTIYSTNSGIDKNKLKRITGNFPYITRSDKNNGIDNFLGSQEEKYLIDNGNIISIGLDTQTVFYQPHKFYTGQNIQILENQNLNYHIAFFLIPLIKKQLEKFNRGGNGATLTRLKRSILLLPIDESGQPDRTFMEQYMRDLEQQQLLKKAHNYFSEKLSKLTPSPITPLTEKMWDEFEIEDIAEIIGGQDIYEKERINGNTPYVSATANNNGIGYFVGNTNKTLEKGCLSVNRNGSVGYCFYHPYYALIGNDCRKLRLKNKSKYVGFFISKIVTNQKEKYGYGYKMGTARLKRQKILLPITKTGTPDYDYMEQHMKQVEYSLIKQYLDRKMK